MLFSNARRIGVLASRSLTTPKRLSSIPPPPPIPTTSATNNTNNTKGDDIIFYVNGERHVVDPKKVDPSSCLLDYLRHTETGLTGSKMACGEGGCGACTVVVSSWNEHLGEMEHRAMNSCLTGIPFVAGSNVTTPEGLGGTRDGLHPIQEAFVNTFGTQCGYCTPGFLMSLYGGVLNGKRTEKELEKVIDGNLCRCTGYRSISEAVREIENKLAKSDCAYSTCTNSPKLDPKSDFYSDSTRFSVRQLEEMKSLRPNSATYVGGRTTWVTPSTLEELLELKEEFPEARLITGNSEVMLEQRFKHDHNPVLTTPIHVPELQTLDFTKDNVLHIGGAVTLTDVDNLLKAMEERGEGGEGVLRAVRAIRRQIHWFSGTSVRNSASVAGNVATASPISDLNPVWVALGASFELVSKKGGKRVIPASEFFLRGYKQINMRSDEIVYAIHAPLHADPNRFTEAFKQSPRREDDIAIVTSAMTVKLHPENDTVEDIKLVFGGMGPRTLSATETENKLKGMKWGEDETLKVAMQGLGEEMELEDCVPGGRPEYRTQLCKSFFYKFFKRTWGERGGEGVEERERRGVLEEGYVGGIEGKLTYDDSLKKVVGKPHHHASSERQVAGEAVYVDDIPPRQKEVYAALVLSDRPHAKILKIDASSAYSVDGFRSFYGAQDVPGENILGDIIQDEELFASEKVVTVGQIVGVVTGESQWAATEAARRVNISYEDLPSILSIQEAIEQESYFPGFNENPTINDGDVDSIFEKRGGERVVEGEINIGGQEHFYFEPNAVICTPVDNEMLVETSTQNLNKTQKFVSSVLGVDANRVTATVRRLGGGFGGKETQTINFAATAAVAAHHERRPVRLLVPRNQDMCGTGKRHPFHGKYKVAYENDGTITAVETKLFSNAGHSHDLSFPVLERAIFHSENAYKIPNIRASGRCCKTNVYSNTAFRGFGGPQGMMVAETWIEHVAHELGIPAHVVREKNLYNSPEQKTHYGMEIGEIDLPRIMRECKEMSDFERRYEEVEEFNKNNKWMKKGISLIPSKFGLAFTFPALNQAACLVHIYTDGSVLVNHGGVEMGQGIHTKILQIVAEELGVPFEKVYLSDTCTSKIANASPTAASVGSDINGMAAQNACRALKERLDQVKSGMEGNPSFKDVVNQAYMDRVSLSEHGFYKTPVSGYNFKTGEGTPFHYFTSGFACSEVELDTLTGDHRVLRSDIAMDVGKSINPMVDIGQIEGAFVQGMGWSTLEELTWGDRHHEWFRPGHFFSNGPGNYKIPSMDDAPRDFNVKLMSGCASPSVHSSRGIGEPPLFLGSSAMFALRSAVAAARKEAGVGENWFHFDSPMTAERLCLLSNGLDGAQRGSW